MTTQAEYAAAPLDAAKLYVKIAASCLKMQNALGIYECGTVWLPENFISTAMDMKNGELPLTLSEAVCVEGQSLKIGF